MAYFPSSAGCVLCSLSVSLRVDPWYAPKIMVVYCILIPRIADGANNAAGMGFNGYSETKSPKWDGVSNINVINVRDCSTSTSLITTCSGGICHEPESRARQLEHSDTGLAEVRVLRPHARFQGPQDDDAQRHLV